MFEKVKQGIKRLTGTRHVKAHDMSDLRCLVTGEGRTSRDDSLETTGEFIIDLDNELGYDVGPNSVRGLVRFGARGTVPHSILFETNSAPFDFVNLQWSKDESTEENILKDGRVAASTQAIIDVQNEEKTEKYSLALLVVSVAFALMCMIIVGTKYL